MPLLDEEDLVINPTTRVPMVFCLDTSGSMSGKKIEELNKALDAFYKVLLEDRTAKYAADACVVTFDSDVRIARPFENVSHNNVPRIGNPSGVTKLGEGVAKALDCLAARKQEYKDNGIEYYQPWLILMTDGKPVQSDPSIIESAAKKCVEMESGRKLTVIPIYFGGSAEQDEALSVMNRFTELQSARSFDPEILPELFRWISMSATTISNSGTGDEPQISFDSFKPQMQSASAIL